MELASKYSPSEVEGKWYEYWIEHKLFSSKPDGREPYTIVIPPPNVTGVLHMGHMLNETIQDILVRRARMEGKNACWVPGTDHASIATEAKVVGRLAEKGIKKTDLTREEFLKHAWEWTDEHGGIILKQLRRLGASCDWDRTSFTMDEVRSESVIKVFVDLYRKGLIYRGVRMVNWDPKAQTALSDEEVVYKEEHSKLYYLRYKVVSPLPTSPDWGRSSDSPQNSQDNSKNVQNSGTNATIDAEAERSIIEHYKTANADNYALLKENSKKQREHPTKAESALWEMLRGKNLNCKFRRQHIIGDFIVDFICIEKRLVIEVDGGYHNHPGQQAADKLRTAILKDLGYNEIRFTNEEIISNTENVLNKIKEECSKFNVSDLTATANTSKSELPLQSERAGERLPQYAIVATTRPETIMGDTAMCINPNDEKNAWLKGKHVIVPLVNREIPVIEDEYVDTEFGTGCLKVTPAHDVNDYMLGEKHNLKSIDIFNDNGTLSEAAGLYVGMDRFDVRKQIEKDLKDADLMEKVEDYDNKVGYSERTNVPIEPKLSMQWFVKMQHFADLALKPVMDDEICFHPAKYKNTYRHWLENIKDWCISRQLWWGHRIPAYYLPEGGYVVAATVDEAVELARQKSGSNSLTAADLRQDDDALDTWFSSWLWPISLFNGINQPKDNKEFDYYYPTDDLVTGPDIIFFWVARMIMAGYEFAGKKPFKNVYFTGIVRDSLGRKMSKSLGNSPDPIALIDKYGADGVRMGMMLSAPAGNDILFDESLCEQGRNFCNKIWNAFRLVKGWQVDAKTAQPETSAIAIEWIEAQIRKSGETLADLFKKYRISEALMEVYRLFRDEFSSWYLEMIKPAYGSPIDKKTFDATLGIFESLLKLLHPFMPFITEELWQHILDRKDGESIMYSSVKTDKATKADDAITSDMETVKNIIIGVRAVRAEKNISPRELLTLNVIGKCEVSERYGNVIKKMGSISDIIPVTEKDGVSSTFMVDTTEYAVPLGSLIDVESEKAKAQAELEHLEGFLVSIDKKLANENFVAHAPEKVVEMERKKKSDTLSKIAALKETLEKLK